MAADAGLLSLLLPQAVVASPATFNFAVALRPVSATATAAAGALPARTPLLLSTKDGALASSLAADSLGTSLMRRVGSYLRLLTSGSRQGGSSQSGDADGPVLPAAVAAHVDVEHFLRLATDALLLPRRLHASPLSQLERLARYLAVGDTKRVVDFAKKMMGRSRSSAGACSSDPLT